VWQTCYGPAISRILASVISVHGDDTGLVIPYCISGTQVVIIPIFSEKNKTKILKEAEKIKDNLENLGIRCKIDSSDKRPGEKFNEWELKGIPFRIELGEKEINEKKVTLFTRDVQKKEKINIKNLDKIKNLGVDFDNRLKKNADKLFNGKIQNCKTKTELKNAMQERKIARIDFCSINSEGEKCAAIVEKDFNAEVRGVLANKKEKPTGRCVICNKTAKEVVYIGKSY